MFSDENVCFHSFQMYTLYALHEIVKKTSYLFALIYAGPRWRKALALALSEAL